ncbi:hypothetical protein ACFSZS_29505 [Seohaeicola zhoushanensis]
MRAVELSGPKGRFSTVLKRIRVKFAWQFRWIRIALEHLRGRSQEDEAKGARDGGELVGRTTGFLMPRFLIEDENMIPIKKPVNRPVIEAMPFRRETRGTGWRREDHREDNALRKGFRNLRGVRRMMQTVSPWAPDVRAELGALLELRTRRSSMTTP